MSLSVPVYKVHYVPGVEQSSAVDIRILLGRFADDASRRALARGLLIVCVIGFAASIAVLAVLGYGTDRWMFVLVVWTVFLFIPLRIAIETLQTVGLRLRDAALEHITSDPRRYDRPEALALLIEHLFIRHATLPRIAKPAQGQKAREAAAAILRRVGSAGGAAEQLRAAIRAALAAAEVEAVALSASASGPGAEDIQSRWEGARALGALGALIQVLTAAHRDRWGDPPSPPELDGRALTEYVEAVLDYCDEAALNVDAVPWTEPLLRSSPHAADAEEIRASWRAFVVAGTPSPRALQGFLTTVLPAR
ncbi:MAG TPA: hypothetical protein VFM39_01195 [bacterium]|nr:hypothetical protein [bacterium]